MVSSKILSKKTQIKTCWPRLEGFLNFPLVPDHFEMKLTLFFPPKDTPLWYTRIIYWQHCPFFEDFDFFLLPRETIKLSLFRLTRFFLKLSKKVSVGLLLFFTDRYHNALSYHQLAIFESRGKREVLPCCFSSCHRFDLSWNWEKREVLFYCFLLPRDTMSCRNSSTLMKPESSWSADFFSQKKTRW